MYDKGDKIESYRVIRLLGTGGMGEVYEVEHIDLGVHYAMKFFSLDHGEIDLLKAKFKVEAKLLSRLRHRNLVRVYDAGLDEESGRMYFVMDLVLGPEGVPLTLAERRRNGKVTQDEIAGWYSDISSALSVIHAGGIVHRDIKLENVLLDGEGRAVLADFGVSRILGDNALGVTRATTMVVKSSDGKVIMGSGDYIAPETAAGGQATEAADYWALGVLVFRLLTGVWYEPGTGVFDLLEPFDPGWKKVLWALLETDPARRRMIPLGDCRGALRKKTVWFAAAFGAALTASALLWVFGSDSPAATEEPAALTDKTFDLAPGVTMRFKPCPAGSFMMGRPGETNRHSVVREHKVVITRPFWMSEKRLSEREWYSVTGDYKRRRDGYALTGVSKPEIMAFCSELTYRFGHEIPEGYIFRLPTEAEWEYAYNAGTSGTNTPFADYRYCDQKLSVTLEKIFMNKYGMSWGERGDYRLALKEPNPWGLYDMYTWAGIDMLWDCIDLSKVNAKAANAKWRMHYGGDHEQTACLYDDVEVDPLRLEGPTEHFIMIQTKQGPKDGARMQQGGKPDYATYRIVIGPDLKKEKYAR